MLQADDGAHFGVAARTQNVSRIRKQPGDPNGPGALVDLAVRKVERALVRIGGTIGQNQLQAQSFVRRLATGLRREAFPPCKILGLADREVNLDRLNRGNGSDRARC